MKLIIQFSCSFIVFLSLVMIEPAMAGPGGKIASTLFESVWGKILFLALFIFFLPLIILDSIKTRKAIKRTRRDLVTLSKYSRLFNWVDLQLTISNIFTKVHECWEKHDLSDAADYITDWYARNQQEVYLDKWESQGLTNVCHVKRLISIQPVLVGHSPNLKEHEETKLVVRIAALMNDYLKDIKTGEIVEGSAKYKRVSKLWVFTLQNNEWKLCKIEDIGLMNTYIETLQTLPTIQSIETRQQ